jgi:hypothetical protein
MRILKDRNSPIATGTMFTVGFVVYASIVLLRLFLQSWLDYAALKSGLVLSPAGMAIIFGMRSWAFCLALRNALPGDLPAVTLRIRLIPGRVSIWTWTSPVTVARIIHSAGFAFTF